MKISIGERLLVMQSLVPKSPNWGWRIVDAADSSVVAESSGIAEDYEVVELSEATFGSFEGRTLLLELLSAAGTVIERDLFTLSGAYARLGAARKTLGLLGENLKWEADETGDYDQGHEVRKTMTLYENATMVTVLESYEERRSFVADFRPDHRFHLLSSQSKEI